MTAAVMSDGGQAVERWAQVVMKDRNDHMLPFQEPSAVRLSSFHFVPRSAIGWQAAGSTEREAGAFFFFFPRSFPLVK